MNIEVPKTSDGDAAFSIAKQLPHYFDARGLSSIEKESKSEMLYGAYEGDTMVGFAIYKEINADTLEMCWLGVSPEAQGKGVGTILVESSLKDFAGKYTVCEVKTLSEADPYEPYKKTRAFYKKLGFIAIETIYPYPNWDDNPCQIFVKFLKDA